jgi:hypothetical protein
LAATLLLPDLSQHMLQNLQLALKLPLVWLYASAVQCWLMITYRMQRELQPILSGWAQSDSKRGMQ